MTSIYQGLARFGEHIKKSGRPWVQSWICPFCRKEVSIKLQESNENQQIADNSDSETGNENDTETMSLRSHEEMLRHDLEVSLEVMDVSPIKLHSVASHSKVVLGKRKLEYSFMRK
jgi:uncharacterized Zn finger protein (UPF0148 family)